MEAVIVNKVEAILFDIGETLLCFGRTRSSVLLRRAAQLSYDYLKSIVQPVGSFQKYLLYNHLAMQFHIIRSAITGNDFDALVVLKDIGQKRGYDLDPGQWDELHFCWYRPLYERASTEPGLVETLSTLASAGIKLGLVSNTFVHCTALERHMDQLGILRFFDVRVYSYQHRRRKPHRDIFLHAARQIQSAPANILYVGDRIDKDVKGSLGAGMQPVLKTAYTNAGKTLPANIAADVIRIDRISELTDIVKKINASPQFSSTTAGIQAI